MELFDAINKETATFALLSLTQSGNERNTYYYSGKGFDRPNA